MPGLSALADALVLKRVSEQTSGHLRYVLSSSANLSTDTQTFMKAALSTVLHGASVKQLRILLMTCL